MSEVAAVNRNQDAANAYRLDFPRLTGEPLLAGALRSHPSDFVVVENLGFDPSGEGEHVYLDVRKTGANTAWVASQLARFAGVREFDVNYAGKKDRHAVTRQWFSCWLPGTVAPRWQAHGIEGVEILSSVRHNKKLRRGMHLGNQFRIVVRLPGPPSDSAVADFRDRIARIGTLGFPNYFGEQRFGHDGNNLPGADALFKGKRFKRAKREMYLSAARSYLFNCELGRQIDHGLIDPDSEGWLAGVTRGGERRGCDAPGFDEWYLGFERAKVKAMRRRNWIRPEGLTFEIADTNLVLGFGLPAGSYATSLLRELVAYNSNVDHGDQAFG